MNLNLIYQNKVFQDHLGMNEGDLIHLAWQIRSYGEPEIDKSFVDLLSKQIWGPDFLELTAYDEPELDKSFSWCVR